MQKSPSTFTSTSDLFVRVLAVEITRRTARALLLRSEHTHSFAAGFLTSDSCQICPARLELLSSSRGLWISLQLHFSLFPFPLSHPLFFFSPSPFSCFVCIPSPVLLILPSNSYNSSDSSSNLVHYRFPFLSVLC